MMYYELGTMVSVRKDALPFANHEKGISIPSMDVVGELIGIHPSTLSYVVNFLPQLTHSRLLLIVVPSSDERESITLLSRQPQ